MEKEQKTITNANEVRQNKLNVPTLRFAEYTDEWHKFALSDFVTRVTRRNKNNESSLPLTISAQYGLVDQITFFNKTVASVDLSGYYLLYNGDFAYNKSYSNDYAWGAVKRLDKYEKGCLSSLYFVFRPTDKVDSDYLTHYFETNKWHKGISDIAGEGARNHGLLNMSVDNYFATKHYLPTLPEQRKIADFLNLIVKRIEIQNKIISKYETLIKGIREKIANSDWKWIKLDELIKNGVVILNRGNIIPKHAKSDLYQYPVYSSSTQNNGLMGYNDSYMFDKELITWSIDGGGNFFYRNKHKFSVTNVCGIMQVDESAYLYRFIAEMLTYQHSKMKFDYQSKAHPSVISTLYSLPVVPLAMQSTYCQLFIATDKIISTEKTYLSKLKEQKNYLLSKMFI